MRICQTRSALVKCADWPNAPHRGMNRERGREREREREGLWPSWQFTNVGRSERVQAVPLSFNYWIMDHRPSTIELRDPLHNLSHCHILTNTLLTSIQCHVKNTVCIYVSLISFIYFRRSKAKTLQIRATPYCKQLCSVGNALISK